MKNFLHWTSVWDFYGRNFAIFCKIFTFSCTFRHLYNSEWILFDFPCIAFRIFHHYLVKSIFSLRFSTSKWIFSDFLMFFSVNSFENFHYNFFLFSPQKKITFNFSRRTLNQIWGKWVCDFVCRTYEFSREFLDATVCWWSYVFVRKYNEQKTPCIK